MEQANLNEVILDVNHAVAVSSDGRYRIESYGALENITAGGLYSAEGLRLVEIETEEELWSMTPGYYEQSFLWSPTDRYVAIYVKARTYSETFVIDTETMTELSLPRLEYIRQVMSVETTVDEHRADVYFKITEWLNDAELEVTFRWTGENGEEYKGTFIHDVTEDKLLNVKIN